MLSRELNFFEFWIGSIYRLCPLVPFLVMMIIGAPAHSQSFPSNAKPNYFGTGWECIRGYRKVLNSCEVVVVPENAQLNYLGNGWECIRGYRNIGTGCVRVVVPENAELTFLGNDWQCRRGYRNNGLNCVLVQIPENAQLNFLGNDWECKKGFAKAGVSCRRMTALELQAEAELEDKVAAYMRARAARSSDGECDTEPDTNSEVCISLEDAELECDKAYSGEYYRGCVVEIDYRFTTDYSGSGSIAAYFECEAELKHQGTGGGMSRTTEEDESASATLYGSFAPSGSLDIDFSFSSYLEVQKVELVNASCSITSLSR